MCWNYFGRRNCKNNDCMFLHVVRPHNLANNSIEKSEELNNKFEKDSKTKFCVDKFLGRVCRDHSNCNNVQLKDLSLNDQAYLKKWFLLFLFYFFFYFFFFYNFLGIEFVGISSLANVQQNLKTLVLFHINYL